LAFNNIGFRWSSVQWLIAALGVGLGFGLQEIVANFICGLIVLFERPFKVGDTVTIGEVNGTVSRIRIRATTIVDWDRKELIVPNMEFITGQLINWSLSDPITRFIIPVGIAYGSDTELAEKLRIQRSSSSKSGNSKKPKIIAAAFIGN
jgi:potassium efflux system protein